MTPRSTIMTVLALTVLVLGAMVMGYYLKEYLGFVQVAKTEPEVVNTNIEFVDTPVLWGELEPVKMSAIDKLCNEYVSNVTSTESAELVSPTPTVTPKVRITFPPTPEPTPSISI